MAANSSVGELAATTIDNYSGTLADNVSIHSPLLRQVFLKGNNKPASGGTTILQELMYAENSTFKWYSGSETLDIANTEVLDAAQFDWKQANVNVVFNGLEEIKNSGDQRIHDLIKAKIQVAEKTAKNGVAASIFSAGTGSGGKEIGGLQLLVADDPTTGTVGGINRATYTFWRNKTYDFSSEAGGVASSSNILTGMNTAWRKVTRDTDMPDTIVFDDDYYGYFEAAVQTNQRFVEKKATEATVGFETIGYKSANVFYDANCPDLHGYMLNTDYLFFRYHPDRNFSRKKQRDAINQDASVIPLFWAGNLTTSNASLQCVLKN